MYILGIESSCDGKKPTAASGSNPSTIFDGPPPLQVWEAGRKADEQRIY